MAAFLLLGELVEETGGEAEGLLAGGHLQAAVEWDCARGGAMDGEQRHFNLYFCG